MYLADPPGSWRARRPAKSPDRGRATGGGGVDAPSVNIGRDSSTPPSVAGSLRPAADADGQVDPATVWAQPHVEEPTPEPTPAREARVWFARGERRASVSTRVARRTASLVA